jgi:hypothetical protein
MILSFGVNCVQITALTAYKAWSLAAAAGQHAGWVFSQVSIPLPI